MPPSGRPPKVKGERRRAVGLSLGDSEIAALKTLSALQNESQGAIVGRLIVAALRREQRRSTPRTPE